MSTEKTANPLTPRPSDRAELTARGRLADLTACAARGLALPGLSVLIGARDLGIGPGRISLAPACLPDDAICLALTGGTIGDGQRSVLAFPRALARQIVDRALGRVSTDRDEALTSGEEGALLFAIDRAGGDWIGAGGASFLVRGLLADAAQVDDYLGQRPEWQVAAEIVADGVRGPVWLWSLRPTSDTGPTRVAAIDRRALDWPVLLRIVVGRSALPGRALDGIGSGDVLELDELCHPLSGANGVLARVVSGGCAHRARWLDGRRLELVSTDPRRSAMAEEIKGPQVVTGELVEPLDRASGSMEVVVQVELGRVAMSLKQALGLVAGGVIELDRDAGPAVALRVGEKLVASGVLVECEGRLAVQITEVA